MNKVFIVIECEAYEGDTVLRVFNKYNDALAYGEFLVEGDVIQKFVIQEREVY